MLLAATAKKLRLQKKSDQKQKYLELFHHQPKKFYANLQGNTTTKITNPPSQQQIEIFWNSLLGEPSTYNKNATWLDFEKENISTHHHPNMEPTYLR